MTQHEYPEIVVGTVVEFFESKLVLAGICTAVKDNRLTVLTEHNREVNMARSRLIHVGGHPIDTKLSRDDQLKKLAAITALRRGLMEQVRVEELWSLIEGEEEGFDTRGLAEFVFSDSVTDNHVAAVQRILLQDRIFFQFKEGKFFARTQEKVENRQIEIQREEEREASLEKGAQWLQAVWNRKPRPHDSDDRSELIEKLKGYCLFGQEYPESAYVKELFRRANIPPQPQSAFRLLVRLGIWTEDENLFLHEQNISPDFPEAALDLADRAAASDFQSRWDPTLRRDLRDLHTFTIDSAMTRDYDDALSLRDLDDGLYEVGIHIADAAEFVTMGDPLDQEAEARATSIYLPDGRIAMLPPSLSEDVCSLKAGHDRLAMSFLIRMDSEGVEHGHEIVLSAVRIRSQMTYEEVNERVAGEPFLKTLYDLALKLREQRLARGATILPLPEIHVYVNDAGMIQLSRYEKETPSQIMVSEWMIAANGLAASYLSERKVPAIFRSQAECKPESDFTQSDHEIFRIYRQRRLFARAELDVEPKTHCSLAMEQYTTVTSPIRRYMDLVVQRQIKHMLTTQAPCYTGDDLRQLITKLGALQTKIAFIQRKWNRYWILKYMEQEDLQALDALVLDINSRFAHLLLPDFLIEANLPLVEKGSVQRGEMIKVKIERLNPREDLLRLQL